MVVIQLLMARRSKNQDDLDFKFSLDKSIAGDDSEEVPKSRKKKKKDDKVEKYQCGSTTCNKIYHSYTAFYNHCKKAHSGQFPENSLMNGKLFAGPSKNRGRPRITKVDAKNPYEIEAMKSENELIEFLGTINVDKEDKKEDVIISVQDAVEQMNKAIETVVKWGLTDHNWLNKVKKYNEAISSYDLPQFYDPIDYNKFPDQVDTYNFVSIVKFLSLPENRDKCDIERFDRSVLEIVTIVWLARIISVSLLSEVIYVLGQNHQRKVEIDEKEYFAGKSKKFLEVISKFFRCYDNGEKQENEEKEIKSEPYALESI